MEPGFLFSNVISLDSGNLPEAGLAILHIDKAPPHIMFFAVDQFYSLEVKGPRFFTAYELLKIIRVKRIPFFLIALKLPGHQCPEKSAIESVFRSYEALRPGESCLAPVNQVIRQIYGVVPARPMLFGLLELVYASGLVLRTEQLFADAFLNKGRFLLKGYEHDAIRERISVLRADGSKK